MPLLSRRDFIKRTLAAGLASGLVLFGLEKTAGGATITPRGTFYDLTKCDGCQGLKVPRCVSACREENNFKFPRPAERIEYYWPQKKKEDWQDKRDLTTRLTPYNWTFVQHVQVKQDGRVLNVFIPRRCMHCDNPPCANLCPFGAQSKTPEGSVIINPNLCLGGAKCRDVCPWGIPARQAGVGLYMKLAPRYVGGGVMYKCDLCYHRIKEGKIPACVEACPRGAIVFGDKEEMREQARKRAREIGGYIYGDKENGGTSTFYVSPVSFAKIHEQLMMQKNRQPNPEAPGFPGMPEGVGNFLDSVNGIAGALLAAPLAGAFAAGYAAYRTIKGGEDHGG
ncbi:MAG: formate dehydrogenase iron-sulfur subunit [Thermoanaerobacter sp.]|jgi:Fe-S-cluster-containing dehydrogenase component|nr:formate dehydrogenase iron-sulfur subunit [Thermoanaerobacter sp.]